MADKPLEFHVLRQLALAARRRFYGATQELDEIMTAAALRRKTLQFSKREEFSRELHGKLAPFLEAFTKLPRR